MSSTDIKDSVDYILIKYEQKTTEMTRSLHVDRKMNLKSRLISILKQDKKHCTKVSTGSVAKSGDNE